MSLINIESGVLDRTRLVGNILMIILLIGNVYFSVQYIQSIKDQSAVTVDNTSTHIQEARFLREFIGIVLDAKGTVSYDDRVKLENDVLQLHDASITAQWQSFVNSTSTVAAQTNAVSLMSLITDKMLQ